MTIEDDDGNNFKVNGQRLKVFLEPNHDYIDEIKLISFKEYTKNL